MTWIPAARAPAMSFSVSPTATVAARPASRRPCDARSRSARRGSPPRSRRRPGRAERARRARSAHARSATGSGSRSESARCSIWADRVGGALRGGPVGRVRVGQELEVAPRSLGAPAGELRIDLVVAGARPCGQHLARDPASPSARRGRRSRIASPGRLSPRRSRSRPSSPAPSTGRSSWNSVLSTSKRTRTSTPATLRGNIRGRSGFDVVGSPVELQAEVPGRPRKTTGKQRKCEERTRTRSPA